MSDGFRLSEPSARTFDALAARVGAVVAGRNTYEDSEGFGGGSPHPSARLFVLSRRPVPEMSERQTLVTTGIQDAVAAAREAADGKDVGLIEQLRDRRWAERPAIRRIGGIHLHEQQGALVGRPVERDKKSRIGLEKIAHCKDAPQVVARQPGEFPDLPEKRRSRAGAGRQSAEAWP